jgi:parallel beta-helix repeat protein
LSGGEIYVLGSANYGGATINKTVTITTVGGIAGVNAISGAAITINAGATDVVNLDGLDLDGSNSGATGIQFNSGAALNVRRMTIHNFTNSGIAFTPTGASSLVVIDSAIRNNAGSGIMVGGAAPAAGAINRVIASANGVGILVSGSGSNVTVSNSIVSNNNYGIGASFSAAAMIQGLTASSNSVGIAADQSAVVLVGQSNIVANGTGWQATNSGQVRGLGNTNVTGNTTDNSWTGTVALK